MHISAINIYPVKSLMGIALQESAVESRGLKHDRRWMLTDRKGHFFTQREFPKMATIRVAVAEDHVSFSVGDSPEFTVPSVPGTGDRQSVTIWQSFCEGEIYPDDVSKWFCEVLGTDCQLVYMPDESRRSVNSRFDRGDDIVSFADGYPLMIINENSLADLNSRLGDELSMDRFRPNLVVTGADPFAEDGWKRIGIGDAIFRVTKPCARCIITTVDQSTGTFAGKEPLKTLASYRMARAVYPDTFDSFGMGANDVLFGQNLIPETVGVTIRVGDEVELL